jgi:HEAT repeat protein/cyclophilin family peptidyl-prolyl cis-trans isomerase
MGSLSKGLICLVSLAVLSGCAGSTRSPEAEPRSGTAAGGEPTSEMKWRAGLLQAEDTGRANEALREGLASEDVERRRASVRTLAFVRDSSMAGALLAAFEDPDGSVRAEAILTAGLSGVTDALPAIIERREDPDKLVRSAVGVALGLLPSPAGISPLTELLDDEFKEVRLAACYSAARLTDADDIIEPLLETFEDPDADVSAAALYALSRLSGRLDALGFAVRFEIRTKLVQLAKRRDPSILILIAEGLYNPIAGEQADTLHAMLEADQPEVLLAILRSTSIPGAPAFVFHEVLIKHSDSGVVQGTILGLGRMKGDAVNDLLLTFIFEDARDWLRAEAIRSLAKTDARLMLEIANGLSNEPRPTLRAAVAETLYGREEPEAATYARRLFETDDAWVKLHAIPAMASVEEPLSSIFGGLLKRASGEASIQMIRAAGYRLAMSARSEADHADAVALLAKLWKHAVDLDSAGIQLAVLDAAAEGEREDGAALIRKALKAADLGVRLRAASLLRSRFDEEVTLELPKQRPLSYYEDIVEWAGRQHAAVVTVERQGFIPGRFTISLDSQNAPMTSWRFAQLANQGYYDNRRVNPFLPGLRLHSGRGGDNRYAQTTWRAEPVFSLFGPGTLAATGHRDALMGEWLVTLGARPNYLGRYTPFGRVVQNLPGVVANVLPIDRVVGVRVYEGHGGETLPPIE